MDLSSINPVVLAAALMVAATPILLAAIGELVVEKSGVLNLGVEGMMIVGAVWASSSRCRAATPIWAWPARRSAAPGWGCSLRC
jgi:general nucleoside transport system permease protein